MTDSGRCKDVQQVLSSLLVSKKDDCTIEELERDYQEVEGERIPWRELGYATLLSFLQSSSKYVTLINNNGRYFVKPVVTEKVQHVKSLVDRQKSSVRRSCRGRRPYFNVTHRPPFRRLSAQALGFIMNNVRENPHGLSLDYILKMLHFESLCYGITITNLSDQLQAVSHQLVIRGNKVYPTECAPVPVVDKDYTNENERSASYAGSSIIMAGEEDERSDDNEDEVYLCPAGYTSQPCVKSRIEKSVSDFVADSISRVQEEQNYISEASCAKEEVKKNEEIFTNIDQSEQENHDSIELEYENNYEEVCDSETVSELINTRIRFRLEKLIQAHPDGIYCADLPEMYLNVYGLTLNYSELGFSSVCEFAVHLPDIFHCIQPSKTEDFILFDAKAPIPDIQKRDRPSVNNLSTLYSIYDELEEVEPLPTNVSNDISQRLIPEDVMTFGETVGQVSIVGLGPLEKQYEEVIVVEVFTPSYFWIHLRRKRRRFDDFMDELHIFYKENSSRYMIPPVILEKGLNCACLFLGKWHRAIIKSVSYNGSATVLFYDYGTLKTYPHNELYFLHRRFSYLPAQAIPCGLYNTKPCKGVEWTRSVTTIFTKMTVDIPMIAIIAKTDLNNNSMLITLVDTRGDEDVHICDWMVQNQLAEYGSLVCIRPKNFPFLFYNEKYRGDKTLGKNFEVPILRENIGKKSDPLVPNFQLDDVHPSEVMHNNDQLSEFKKITEQLTCNRNSSKSMHKGESDSPSSKQSKENEEKTVNNSRKKKCVDVEPNLKNSFLEFLSKRSCRKSSTTGRDSDLSLSNSSDKSTSFRFLTDSSDLDIERNEKYSKGSREFVEEDTCIKSMNVNKSQGCEKSESYKEQNFIKPKTISNNLANNEVSFHQKRTENGLNYKVNGTNDIHTDRCDQQEQLHTPTINDRDNDQGDRISEFGTLHSLYGGHGHTGFVNWMLLRTALKKSGIRDTLKLDHMLKKSETEFKAKEFKINGTTKAQFTQDTSIINEDSTLDRDVSPAQKCFLNMVHGSIYFEACEKNVGWLPEGNIEETNEPLFMLRMRRKSFERDDNKSILISMSKKVLCKLRGEQFINDKLIPNKGSLKSKNSSLISNDESLKFLDRRGDVLETHINSRLQRLESWKTLLFNKWKIQDNIRSKSTVTNDRPNSLISSNQNQQSEIIENEETFIDARKIEQTEQARKLSLSPLVLDTTEVISSTHGDEKVLDISDNIDEVKLKEKYKVNNHSSSAHNNEKTLDISDNIQIIEHKEEYEINKLGSNTHGDDKVLDTSDYTHKIEYTEKCEISKPYSDSFIEVDSLIHFPLNNYTSKDCEQSHLIENNKPDIDLTSCCEQYCEDKETNNFTDLLKNNMNCKKNGMALVMLKNLAKLLNDSEGSSELDVDDLSCAEEFSSTKSLQKTDIVPVKIKKFGASEIVEQLRHEAASGTDDCKQRTKPSDIISRSSIIESASVSSLESLNLGVQLEQDEDNIEKHSKANNVSRSSESISLYKSSKESLNLDYVYIVPRAQSDDTKTSQHNTYDSESETMLNVGCSSVKSRTDDIKVMRDNIDDDRCSPVGSIKENREKSNGESKVTKHVENDTAGSKLANDVVEASDEDNDVAEASDEDNDAPDDSKKDSSFAYVVNEENTDDNFISNDKETDGTDLSTERTALYEEEECLTFNDVDIESDEEEWDCCEIDEIKKLLTGSSGNRLEKHPVDEYHNQDVESTEQQDFNKGTCTHDKPLPDEDSLDLSDCNDINDSVLSILESNKNIHSVKSRDDFHLLKDSLGMKRDESLELNEMIDSAKMIESHSLGTDVRTEILNEPLETCKITEITSDTESEIGKVRSESINSEKRSDECLTGVNIILESNPSIKPIVLKSESRSKVRSLLNMANDLILKENRLKKKQ
ncbi:uncharacterized protein LOC105701330 isoform X1 [Orussus abietinus]|uniref:uncharacterized protein LOC105701330 isoform X1 n=1 Tax=Orussus abietinus TaxID=222816 RepID=UPI0006259F06|nr:uncharacterized protein LOC105701330 isoform X1 [Orussus abietinus]XP_012283429.1 uncharacterized protein LOC105701330 isoform X1 [Orussus abietinus]